MNMFYKYDVIFVFICPFFDIFFLKPYWRTIYLFLKMFVYCLSLCSYMYRKFFHSIIFFYLLSNEYEHRSITFFIDLPYKNIQLFSHEGSKTILHKKPLQVKKNSNQFDCLDYERMYILPKCVKPHLTYYSQL